MHHQVSAGFSGKISASADVEATPSREGAFMDMVEMLAWCGAALSCVVSIPQAIHVLRADRLDGISASTYLIVLGNAGVWTAWALLTGEFAAGVPGLVNGPAAILILCKLLAASRVARTDQVAAPAALGRSHNQAEAP
jgi:uncharacterized protein with PQ loop repeat